MQESIPGTVLLNIFINGGGDGVHSSDLKMAPNWRKQIVWERLVLSSRGTQTGWRNGLTGSSLNSGRSELKPIPGEEEPLAKDTGCGLTG